MKLSEALEMFALAKIGESSSDTMRWYKQRIGTLVSFLEDMPIKDITLHDLRRWRAWLWEKNSRWADHPGRPEEEGGLSPWTRHGYIRAIRRFFNFLVNEGLLEHSPAQRLELPSRPKNPPKFIRQEDALAILRAAKDNPRDYSIVRFLAETACRVGGITSLTLDNLDLKGLVAPNGTVVYHAQVEEKGFRGVPRIRIVYFGEKTAEALRAYLAVRPQNGSERVFIGQHGPLQESGFYQVLKRLAKKAGVKKGWNPHAFRHGWAYGARINGADIADVSDSLGHSDISVTINFYSQLPDPEIGERHVRFSWINLVEDDATEEESADSESAEND